MARPSSIDRLPPQVREKIGKLRGLGWTIDQILEHLNTLLDKAPSRSALGRHVHGLDAVAEQMRRSRQVAEALVDRLGEAPESRTARVNIELLHSALLDLFMKAADDGQNILTGDAEQTMFLAKTLDHLARASKTNADFIKQAEERAATRAKTQAAAAVETIARDRGISAETLNAIKSGIFGVKAA